MSSQVSGRALARRWWPAPVAAAAVGAALVLLPLGGDPEPQAAPAAPAAVVPAAAPAAAVQVAPVQPAPAPGTVRLVEGTFTDRVGLRTAELVPGATPVVEGSLDQRVDTSEVLVLEVRADFYDASGVLLGSASDVQTGHAHGAEEPVVPEDGDDGGEDLPFRVEAPAAFADRVSAALLSVPQLVNE